MALLIDSIGAAMADVSPEPGRGGGSIRRPVWCDVIYPPAYGMGALVIRERRWVDADGRQWRTDDRPLTPAMIVAGAESG